MKIKIKKKEMKCLITCEHVISQKDINDNIIINIYYGEDNKDSRQIKLDNEIRFMKVFDKDMTYIEVKGNKKRFYEDVTLIEIIENDKISEDKYLDIDLNYKQGFD